MEEVAKLYMDKVKTYWWSDIDNAGDYFSTWLLDKILGEVIYSEEPDIVCSGSILASSILTPTTKVWGAGFNNTYSEQVVMNPDCYYAVRGQLTLDKLDIGKKVILGDPGLLLSYFYKEKVVKEYDIGFVLHYVDKQYQEPLSNLGHIISMNTIDIDSVAREISKCRFIYSSSLHGLIFAHSLGIPAKHLEMTPLSSRHNFKFKDYYTVLGIPYQKEIYTPDNSFMQGGRNHCVPDKGTIKQIQKDLLRVFPYPMEGIEE